jgi:plasmid rolling circle replication initiator protein Rep
LPVLQTWKDVHFVTLTIKAVKAPRMPVMIKAMNQAFRLVKAKNAKRSKRGTGQKLMGLKSLECNFNPKTKTYNPHLRLLVPSREMAEKIIDEWLQLWTKRYTHRDAQNCRIVEDTEKYLIELIKYEAKIFTEPD